MRIAFLGDSLTWGGYGGDFVAEIARAKPQHEIVNAGVGGNTVVNLLRRLDDVLAQEPDGIFVMVGGNDVISTTYPAVHGYYMRAQGIREGFISPDRFARTYRDLLTRIQLEHRLVWVGLPPIEWNPVLVAALKQYNGLASDAARSLNVPVLDLAARFIPEHVPWRPPVTFADIARIGERVRDGWRDYESDRQAGGFTYTFDGAHLTPEGAVRFAEYIIGFLKL